MTTEQEQAVAAAISLFPLRQRNALMRNEVHDEAIVSIAKRHGIDERTTRRDVEQAKWTVQKLRRRFIESS